MTSHESNEWNIDMVATQTNRSPIDINQSNKGKQVSFLEILKHPQFSGQLQLKSSKGQQWMFYIYSGQVVYASGGTHPNRRWRRNLAIHSPKLLADGLTWYRELETVSSRGGQTAPCWQYQLLCLWKNTRKISQELILALIHAELEEILFDIAQAAEVSYEVRPQTLLFPKLALANVDRSVAIAQKNWQAYQAAKFVHYSPDRAPIIRQPEQFRFCVSEQTYQTLRKLLDGQRTLRDLAVQMRRSVVDIIQSLLPYIQRQFIELVEVSDLPNPGSKLAVKQSGNVKIPDRKANNRPPPSKQPAVKRNDPKKPLIACVDDSPMICQTLEKILTEAGYRFMALNDALRAIVSLMMHKPDLIFLDLVMPDANGYEICTQLRRLSFFRTIPIIILTGNDGIIDRVRAKMVGSSDFLSKPIDPESVLTVVQKHLKQKSST